MYYKKHIPNCITLLNLLCGCIAVVFVSNNQFETAFYLVCLGIFLDFFDGFFARLYDVSSPLGLQLDSLADMVTSGVVPGFVMYKMLLTFTNHNDYFSCLGFCITLGSCYRLANFNIDTRQTETFIGLPTPANTLFIMSLPLLFIEKYFEFNFIHAILIIISFLSVYMMNAEIPLFSLKIKKMGLAGNQLQLFFLLVSLLLLVLFQYLGVALVIVFYVLLSVIKNKIRKGNK
jgi:CDP-diacylglycerol---serine O-phosphatidyltransferase